MSRLAFSFVRKFDPAPVRRLRVDHHYLLCASTGALRLEADDTTWTLPPVRAALIAAGHEVDVTVAQPVTTASVLISPEIAPPPAAPLAVFDLSPLARELVAECGRWEESDEPLTDRAGAVFDALVAVTWELAENPSRARMPSGRTPEVRRALALTEARLAETLHVGAIAADVGLTSRSLARRFEAELGMTWQAALRRLRILRAIEQLAGSDASVTRIAMAVGYSSLSAFNLAFRDLTGQTPSEYRDSFGP